MFIRSQSHFTKMVLLHTKELNNRKIITIKLLTNSYLLRELQKVIKREEGKTEKVSHFLIRNFPNKRTLQFGWNLKNVWDFVPYRLLTSWWIADIAGCKREWSLLLDVWDIGLMVFSLYKVSSWSDQLKSPTFFALPDFSHPTLNMYYQNQYLSVNTYLI